MPNAQSDGKGYLFEPGTLWRAVQDRAASALISGALQPVPTSCCTIEQAGIQFLVNILDSLVRKSEAKRIQERMSRTADARVNPFLPYDPELFISDLLPSHVALLNKYNVVDHHVLVVTRQFEQQEELLTLEDFLALWAFLVAREGIGFYNGGVQAGASQCHKHLQFIPLPLSPARADIPIGPVLAAAAPPTGQGTCSLFSFQHGFSYHGQAVNDPPTDVCTTLLNMYRHMLRHVGMTITGVRGELQQFPYNLLLSREWMMIVPRQCEFFRSISLNALAFIGSLFVMNEREFSILEKEKPLTALKHVTRPASGS
ncbi:phosphorylase [bacterium]|nr:phosphorylase [bacterium]